MYTMSYHNCLEPERVNFYLKLYAPDSWFSAAIILFEIEKLLFVNSNVKMSGNQKKKKCFDAYAHVIIP